MGSQNIIKQGNKERQQWHNQKNFTYLSQYIHLYLSQKKTVVNLETFLVVIESNFE